MYSTSNRHFSTFYYSINLSANIDNDQEDMKSNLSFRYPLQRSDARSPMSARQTYPIHTGQRQAWSVGPCAGSERKGMRVSTSEPRVTRDEKTVFRRHRFGIAINCINSSTAHSVLKSHRVAHRRKLRVHAINLLTLYKAQNAYQQL